MERLMNTSLLEGAHGPTLVVSNIRVYKSYCGYLVQLFLIVSSVIVTSFPLLSLELLKSSLL